jgi:hypothetical protein
MDPDSAPTAEYPAFQGLFIPYRLQMVLAGSLEHYTTGPTNQAEATYWHESVHWWQTAMTGYGHNAWHLFRQLTGFVFNEWLKETAVSPAGRVISLDSLLAGREQRNAQLHAVKWTAENTLRIASARFRVRDPDKDFKSLFVVPPPGAGPWKINPEIRIGGEPYWLQGMDVAEAHARWSEVMFRRMFHEVSFDQILQREVSPKYRIAFEWFASEVGGDRSLLFPFVCDLALQTIWNDMPQTEDEWQATSPSWRFYRLTTAIRNGAGTRDVAALIDNYTNAADELLAACGFSPLEAVTDAAVKRANYRKPNMLIEERMFAAMRFRQKYPFCLAYPWAVPEIWQELQEDYQPPIIQISGKINLHLPPIRRAPEISCDPSAFMTEVAGELLLQAFVMQILGKEPEIRPVPGMLQCGFAYFNVQDVCPHQVRDNCPGSFVPANGPPFPAEQHLHSDDVGCPLEKMLWAAGVKVKDLQLRS